VKRICDRFHVLAMHMRQGHKGRRTWLIRNELDVQHLFKALLLLDFENVQAEVWTPPYAGGSARMDFLIRPHNIVVEAKMTRKGLAERGIADQLLVDFARYERTPACRVLYCFVYDPQSRIKNATGLREDLESRSSAKLTIKVAVRPFG
jgi:hypothetical protein